MDVLICEPVEGRPSRYIVPDSLESTCQDCGARVYIAPSGQKVMDQMIVVCTPCGLARIESGPPLKCVLAKGAIEEIKTFQKRN